MTTAEKSERPEQNQDLRCQSGPSAKDSVIFSEGKFSKNCGADQQRLQISDLHFDKFPTPATFACWKIRFKTDVRTCSQFPTEAMQWIKAVELVDSVDDLRSSSSTRGISMPNFEVLARVRLSKSHPCTSTFNTTFPTEPEVLEAEAQVGKWLNFRARITSKELAPSRMIVLQVRKWMHIWGKVLLCTPPG